MVFNITILNLRSFKIINIFYFYMDDISKINTIPKI